MRVIASAFLVISGFLAGAQDNWLWNAGGEGNDESLSNCIDKSGNIYTAGYFSLTANFSNIILSSSGSGDIFVSKQDSTGDYIWVVKAGGKTSDRAYSIHVANEERIYITGFFTDTAQFGSTTLISLNNSQDIFVACLDSSGTFLWAKSFGGADIDLAFAVAANSKLDCIVTGQFKGQAQFGANTFTSTTNPLSGLPSFDVFILTLDSAGNVLWAKKGSAPFDDRGIALTTDEADCIYLTGQFSDSISFTSTYVSNGLYTGFILKTDSAGNEIWLRMIVAPLLMPRDIEFRNQAIYLCGDYRNTMVFLDTVAVLVANPYVYNFFIAKLDTSGHLAWIEADGSDNEVSCLSIDVDSLNNIYGAGLFRCTMSEYSSLTDSAIFNSIGYRDVFVFKYNSFGSLRWTRHYGGPEDDFCSAISILADDEPVIAGSFERRFNIPQSASHIVNSSNHDSSMYGPVQPNVYCNDSFYNKYVSVAADGNKDIFISKPFNSLRTYYDYYDRSGIIPCYRNVLPCYINYNLDTISGCDSVLLFVTLRTGRDGVIGPEYSYLWSNGLTNDTIVVTAGGNYFVNVTHADLCNSFTDSVYVNVYQTPPVPSYSATNALVYQALPELSCLTKVLKIDTAVSLLNGSGFLPGYLNSWLTGAGNFLTDTIQILTTGPHTLQSVSPAGNCSNDTCAEVFFVTVQQLDSCLGGFDGNPPEIHFPGHDGDTIYVCQNDTFGIALTDSISWAAGYVGVIPTVAHWTLNGGYQFVYPYSAPYSIFYHHQYFEALASGNCTVTIEILNPVDGSVLQTLSRNFYLHVYPLPVINAVFSGPLTLCPDDTAMLIITPAGINYLCSGPSIVSTSASGDTLWVDDGGTYTAYFIYTDILTGCSYDNTIFFNLLLKTAPLITMVPASGIICPGDSVLLTAWQGSNYNWYGPLGNVIANTQSVYVTAPGYYHYDYIDPDGCFLVSEFKEVKAFSTPVLIAEPSTVLCPGDSVTLLVISSEIDSIQWMQPLSGNDSIQVVSQPGTYSCSVAACGVLTTVSITITLSNADATITTVDSTQFCSNDSVMLFAVPGMASYTWNPGNINSPVFITDQPGIYSLMVVDYNGCIDSSSVQLDTLPVPPQPVGYDTSVCAGAAIVLTAFATGTIQWYQNINDSAIATGNSFTTPVITSSTVFYLTNSDSLCESDPLAVHVNAFQSSLLPVLSGDNTICKGDSMTLSTIPFSGFSYQWTGPAGFSSQQPSITIFPFDNSHSGYYTLQVSDSNCTSPLDSALVICNPLPDVNIISQSFGFCSGDSALLNSSIALSFFIWLPSFSTDSSIYVNAPGNYQLIGTDFNGCRDTSASVYVSEFSSPAPPAISDTVICTGDSVTLSTNSPWIVEWFDSTFNFIDSGLVYNTGALFVNTIFHVQFIDTNGCKSSFDTITVLVNSPFFSATISGNSVYCEGETLLLSALPVTNATYEWSGPSGFIGTGTSILIPSLTVSNTGIYYLIVSIGSCRQGDSAFVTVNPTPVSTFSLPQVCPGQSVFMNSILYPQATYIWNGPAGFSCNLPTCTISNAQVQNIGTYSLSIVANGCFSDTTYHSLNLYPLPVIELGTDTPICKDETITFSITPGYSMYAWNNVYTGLPYYSISDSGEVTLIAIDQNGCRAYDTINVFLIDCEIFFPNIFTPNDDLLNDNFIVTYADARSFSLLIYNRWGNLIEEIDNISEGWNGKDSNGRDVSDGVYYYTVKVLNHRNENKFYSGFITLAR